MNWLRRIIERWLGIDQMEEQIKDLTKSNQYLRDQLRRQKDLIAQTISAQQWLVTKEQSDIILKKIDLFNDQIKIGTDIHTKQYGRERSWAVICLDGKIEPIVKFVDLGDLEIREIQRFLRQWDVKNRSVIDAPRGMFDNKNREWFGGW